MIIEIQGPGADAQNHSQAKVTSQTRTQPEPNTPTTADGIGYYEL